LGVIQNTDTVLTKIDVELGEEFTTTIDASKPHYVAHLVE
jgi:hypothetical protein